MSSEDPKLEIIVLAAGQGRVCAPTSPRSCIGWRASPCLNMCSILPGLQPGAIHVVVGHAEAVRGRCHGHRSQLSSADRAVGHRSCGVLRSHPVTRRQGVGTFGDVPLMSARPDPFDERAADEPALLMAQLSEPAGYGRVLRTPRATLRRWSSMPMPVPSSAPSKTTPGAGGTRRTAWTSFQRSTTTMPRANIICQMPLPRRCSAIFSPVGGHRGRRGNNRGQ